MLWLSLAVTLGTGVWVGFDAGQRDWSGNGFARRPWMWVLGTLVLWIVVFPLYLFQRGRVPAKA